MKFDEARWLEVIKKPGWYLELNDFAQQVGQKYKDDQDQLDTLNKQVRHFFEDGLQRGLVNLAKDGPNTDEERQPVDTVVIHHTSAKPGYRLSYLNAVHLLNIYVPVYAKEEAIGQPIWSGHFKDGKQVFWGYHWLMRMDGSFKNLLNDDQIGWHAGDWDINKRSIGICLDNDYENQDPTTDILQKLVKFIQTQYPKIDPGQIIGHCEARAKTICPGSNFIETWKPKLLKYF